MCSRSVRVSPYDSPRYLSYEVDDDDDDDQGATCDRILTSLHTLIRSLDTLPRDVTSDGPFGTCKRLYRSLRSVMPQCFQSSCQSQRDMDYFSSEAWIQACQSTVCDESTGSTFDEYYESPSSRKRTEITAPLSVSKRRWGDTVLACINSLCNNSEGQARVNCIVHMCQKRSGR